MNTPPANPDQLAGAALLPQSRGREAATRALVAGFLLLAWGVASTRAELQFDVFVGYGSSGGGDGIVREAGWFPVACEVFNDGPTFDAVFELSSRQLGAGQTRRMAIELPTNTRKRFSFPMFAGSRYTSWDARLLDAQGKVRAVREDLRTRDLGWETFLLGGLPNSFGGLPVFPQAKHNRPEQQPAVSRLSVEQFPENPIALEGLDAVYLNSAKAPDFKVTQAQALVNWVQAGGHLIVAPDQITDITGTPWLAALLPVEFGGVVPRRSGGILQNWIASGATLAREAGTSGVNPMPGVPGLAPARPRATGGPDAGPYSRVTTDMAFEEAELPVFEGRLRDGEVKLAGPGAPLVVSAPRGRGLVTVLAFSPEREPFRSWNNKAWFWARLCGIPGEWLGDNARNLYGGWSLDAVFGAMIETRQVRKLPVEWLLALLVVYLGVIGPFDRWFLKKINRQVLTWVTFPAYVVFFSLLIYYIGYRLRAGETEWNELHVVDVLPRGEQAVLRGRTYASLYSSANARYRLASEQPTATLRSEFLGPSGGRQESARVEAVLKPAGFEADVAVPVWSSLLYVSDWEQAAAAPLTARLTRDSAGRLALTVQNRLSRTLASLLVVAEGRVHELGEVPPGQPRTFTLESGSGRHLPEFLAPLHQRFVNAAQRWRRAFGGGDAEFLELSPAALVAVSLISQGSLGMGASMGGARAFVYPAGLDLGRLLERGQALVFAWDPGQAPVSAPLARFKAPRATKNTWLRLAVPVSRGT